MLNHENSYLLKDYDREKKNAEQFEKSSLFENHTWQYNCARLLQSSNLRVRMFLMFPRGFLSRMFNQTSGHLLRPKDRCKREETSRASQTKGKLAPTHEHQTREPSSTKHQFSREHFFTTYVFTSTPQQQSAGPTLSGITHGTVAGCGCCGFSIVILQKRERS